MVRLGNKKNMDVVIRFNADSENTEVFRDDEVIWSGFIPNDMLESLSDIIESLGMEVDLVEKFDDIANDIIEMEPDEPSYESDESDDE